ncbi:Tim44 domain-containing protein [Pseudoalteromonas spongiae]|uniref:Tim44 domain-containing protein n=1 Tax=Pseudoalteromonas spongiae TaxID=298657 RepID=UPI000C2CFD13|nr:Tim44-like domain-containing protein [Pseudoalteromonas spongiae]
MKKFAWFFALVALMFSFSFDAEARKKFGSKSKGKTKQTTTTQQKQQVDTNNPTLPAKKSSKKGLMGGILGGLLAGGLIAAMLGGDFEGFQFMDFIIIALVAFVLFKLFKAFMMKKAQSQPQFAGVPPMQHAPSSQAAPQQFSNQGFAQQSQSVPMNLPINFDLNGFLQGAREHYHTLQKAWNDNDFTVISEYVSEQLLVELKQERAEVEEVATEVMFIDAELARADTSPMLWEISVRFRGKYRDLGDKQEEPIDEIWHLERSLSQQDAPWVIVGIEDNAA